MFILNRFENFIRVLEEVGFFGSCLEDLLWSHYEAMFFSFSPHAVFTSYIC